jgi:hypothetical protein
MAAAPPPVVAVAPEHTLMDQRSGVHRRRALDVKHVRGTGGGACWAGGGEPWLGSPQMTAPGRRVTTSNLVQQPGSCGALPPATTCALPLTRPKPPNMGAPWAAAALRSSSKKHTHKKNKQTQSAFVWAWGRSVAKAGFAWPLLVWWAAAAGGGAGSGIPRCHSVVLI